MISWKEFAAQLFHSARDLVDVKALSQSAVVIFGGGAVGSLVGELLARSSLGRLTTWDFDKVAVSNLSRSAYDARNLGDSKAKAMAGLCANINPLAQVTPVEGDLLKVPEALLAKLGSVNDVALVAADDFRVHRRLNRILHPVVHCVYPYVTHSGDGGEVIWTSPGQHGCIECLTNADEREAAGVANDFQALGIDMLRIALEATCVILGLLLRQKKGGQLYEEYVDPSKRLLLVFSRRRGIFAGATPADFVSGTVQVDTREAGCRICGRNRR